MHRAPGLNLLRKVSHGKREVNLKNVWELNLLWFYKETERKATTKEMSFRTGQSKGACNSLRKGIQTVEGLENLIFNES